MKALPLFIISRNDVHDVQKVNGFANLKMLEMTSRESYGGIKDNGIRQQVRIQGPGYFSFNFSSQNFCSCSLQLGPVNFLS